MASKNNDKAIIVDNVQKKFKLVYDRPFTLKERLVFWNKTKVDYHEVLKGINLEIKKGESVALIGVNGSGKSTLLKLMTKIIYPNKGTIQTNGKLTSLLELGAGFHQDFTGRENIYFNASIFGLTAAEIDKRVQDIIDFSELGEFIEAPVRTYSSGMNMRLAFSVAINVDADILLIDEISLICDSRDWKNFNSDLRYFFTNHGHYNVDIYYCSQWFTDTDIKIRRMTEQLYYIERKGFGLSMRFDVLRDVVTTDSGEISDTYKFKHGRLFFRPFYYKMFDSFSRKALPELQAELWNVV